MMQPFIKINGNAYPAPSRDISLMVATLVDSARNAKGVMVGQKIGRDQYKLDSLKWLHLEADVWSAILKEFSGFFADVTFWDMVNNNWRTLKMYPGDRTAQILWLDRDTGKPTEYINCCVNIIDVGQ